MTRIENETKKLCSYVGENGEIVKETIELLVARDTEYKIYEMTDYIAKRKFDLAISVIKDMMSKGETSQRILVAVYNYYRRLLHSAISDMSLTELAEVFGIKEFAAKKTKEQASLFKKRALKSAVDGLSDADYKIKSGVADADEQMWLTIFKIMTDR
jgi:DNA polymerase-3 subunit delta